MRENVTANLGLFDSYLGRSQHRLMKFKKFWIVPFDRLITKKNVAKCLLQGTTRRKKNMISFTYNVPTNPYLLATDALHRHCKSTFSGSAVHVMSSTAAYV